MADVRSVIAESWRMSNEALSVANDSILLADVEWGDEARVIAIGEQMGSSQPAAAAVPDWLWNFLHTYIYIIVFAGIAGNVLCIYFFLRNSELSRMSVTQYLMALAVSDVLFLVSLGFTLLQLHNVQWAGVWGLCEVMMYMTYLSTFLSGWYIMAVTVERAMVVRNPFHACRLQKRRARWVVFCITAFGMISNLWVIAMVERKRVAHRKTNRTGIMIIENIWTCAESSTAHQLGFQIMNSVDTVVSFTIPLVVSTVLNIYIIIKLCHAAKQRAIMAPMRSRASTADSSALAAHILRCRSATDPLVRTYSADNSNYEAEMPGRSLTFVAATRSRTASTSNSERRFRHSEYRNSVRRSISAKTTDRSEFRITFVLLTVSIAYLLLNLPSYTIRVWAAFLPPDQGISPAAAVAEQFFYMLFYTQFAINFVLYSCHGIRSKWMGNTKSDRSLTNFWPKPCSREVSRDPVNPTTKGSPRSPIPRNGYNNYLHVTVSNV